MRGSHQLETIGVTVLISSQTVLDEIIEIFTSSKYDDISTLDALEAIRIRERAYRDEQARLAKVYALDTTYKLHRVGMVTVYDINDTPQQEKRRLETVEVKRRDLAYFASQHGIKLDELLNLVEYRRKPVIGKDGGVWEVEIMLPENNATPY